jgi:hypothetical protein
MKNKTWRRLKKGRKKTTVWYAYRRKDYVGSFPALTKTKALDIAKRTWDKDTKVKKGFNLIITSDKKKLRNVV